MVREAALDLHSSSTIPSPIERRSQEAGSKGTGLINQHRTGIKQCTVGREWGEKNKSRHYRRVGAGCDPKASSHKW